MGVEHKTSILPESSLIFDRLPGFNVRLSQAAYAVHPVGKIEAVPMDRGRHRQTVRHVDPYPLAFDGLDYRAVHTAVVPPALRAQAGVKRVVHLLRNQMKDLNAIHYLKWESPAVRDHDRFVAFSRDDRRQRFYTDRSSAV